MPEVERLQLVFEGDVTPLSRSFTSAARMRDTFVRTSQKSGQVPITGDTKGLGTALGAGTRLLARFRGQAQNASQVNVTGDTGGLGTALGGASRLLSRFRGEAQSAGEVNITGDASGLGTVIGGATRQLTSFRGVAQTASEVTFTGNAGGLNSVISQVQSRLGQVEGQISSMATGGGALSQILGAAGVAGGLGLVGSAAVGVNSNLQQSKIAFDTLLGSGTAADKMLRELEQFAKTTPFEFPELVAASKQMLAYGFAAGDVKPLLEAVGNTAAAMGSGSAGVDTITRALGQMRASTVVQLGEMNQLTEQGVPAFEILGESVGKTGMELKDMISAGEVSASTFIKSFKDYAGENYGGLMAAQSKTAQGAFSTLKDVVQMGTADAFRPAFNELTNVVNVLAEFSQSEGASQFVTNFGNALAGGIQKAKDFGTQVQAAMNPSASAGGASMGGGGAAGFIGGLLTTIQGAIPRIKAAVGGLWSTITAGAAAVWPKLQPIITNILSGFKAMAPILRPLGALVGGILVGAFNAVVPILRLVSSGFRLFGQAVGAVGRFLTPYTPLIQKVGYVIGAVLGPAVFGVVGGFLRVAGAAARLVPVFGRLAGPILSGLGRGFQFAGQIAQTVFKGIGVAVGGLARIVGPAISGVARAVVTGWNRVRAGTSAAWRAISTAVGAAWRGISTVVSGAVRAVWTRVQAGWRLVSQGTGAAWRAVSQVISNAWRGISTAVSSAVRAVWSRISQGWTSIRNGTMTAWRAVTTAIGNAWRTISTNVSTAVSALWTRIRTGWDTVRSGTTAAWDAVRQAITSKFQAASDMVGTIVNSIKTKVTDAWNALKSAAGPIWEGISKAMTGAMEAARDTLAGIWNGILEAIAKILDAVKMGDAASAVRGAKWNVGGSSDVKSGGGGGGGSSNLRGFASGGTVQGEEIIRVGEGGRREHIINPAKQDNVHVLRRAASDMGYKVIRDDRERHQERSHRGHRHGGRSADLLPPKQSWGMGGQDGTIGISGQTRWKSELSQAMREWSESGTQFVPGNDVVVSDGTPSPGAVATTYSDGRVVMGSQITNPAMALAALRHELGHTGYLGHGGTGIMRPTLPPGATIDADSLRAMAQYNGTSNAGGGGGTGGGGPSGGSGGSSQTITQTQTSGGGGNWGGFPNGLPGGLPFIGNKMRFGRHSDLKAANLGATHYNVTDEVRKWADDIANATGTSWNTYYGHGEPGGSVESRTVDFWGPGGRGAPIGADAGFKTAEMALSKYGDELLYMIRQGEMWRDGGWKPWDSDPHYDHSHVSWTPDGQKPSGGGWSIPNPLQILFDQMWGRLIDPSVDKIASTVGGGFILRDAAAKSATNVVGDIHDMIDAKIPDTLFDGGGGTGQGGTNAENRKLGEQMLSQSSTPGSWGALDSLWTKESQWSETADNPNSPAYGIPQAMTSVHDLPSGYGPPGGDPGVQIGWGLNYIKGQYGSTDEAWRHSQSTGWYEEGGEVPGPRGRHRPIWAAGGERILPENLARTYGRHMRNVEQAERRHRNPNEDPWSSPLTVNAVHQVRDAVLGLAPAIVDAMDHKITNSAVTHRGLRAADAANQRRLDAQGPRYERSLA